MNLKKTLRFFFAALAVPMLMSLAQAQDRAAFKILPEVIAPDVQPFTATISNGPTTWSIRNAGFEPITLRNRLTQTQDTDNRLVAGFSELTYFGHLKAQAWETAEVDIFRVIDGKMVLVRSDKVAEGGGYSRGWRAAVPRGAITPDATSFQYRFKAFSRPDTDFQFVVQAVDQNGQLSPPSEPVIVRTPSRDLLTKRGPQPQNSIDDAIRIDRRGVGQLDAPTNLTARVTPDAIVTFDWTPPRGRVQGYVVFVTDGPGAFRDEAYLDLAGDGPPILKGDVAILRRKMYRANRSELVADFFYYARHAALHVMLGPLQALSDDRPGGLWELRQHAPDTPVTEAGETYVSINLDPNIPVSVGRYFYSGATQEFYTVLNKGERYTAEVWLRGDARRPVTLAIEGDYQFRNNGPVIPSVELRVTSEWKKHVVEFTVPYVSRAKTRGQVRLAPKGDGRLDIDNFRVYRSDSGYLNWTPEDLNRLGASGMESLRTHALIKLGLRGYSLEQLLNPAGAISSTGGGATLLQNLELMQTVDMNPWLQIDMYLSRAEWLGLIEYLAAPYDPAVDTPETKPWAAKRHALGRTEPWVDQFDRILFEISNETWNRLFRPWVFVPMPDAVRGGNATAGMAYGYYQEYVLEIFRESPYWPNVEDKFVSVLGGWTSNRFTRDAAASSPNSELITLAAYNGGWDEGEGPVQDTPFSYAALLSHAVQVASERTLQHQTEINQILETRDRPLALGTYEAGPGYALNGLNGARVTEEQYAEQERVMKSNAAGTATLDTFLLQAEMGMTIQNFFTYGAGLTWRSHAQEYRGGHLFPSWALLALFNREGTGDMLAVETEAVPTRDLEKLVRRNALDDAPMVAVYATQKDDRVTVFAISRHVPGISPENPSGETEVAITLPFKSASRAKKYTMTGGYRATNVFEAEAGLVSRPLEVPTDGAPLMIESLPPGETMIFVFEGVTPL